MAKLKVSGEPMKINLEQSSQPASQQGVKKFPRALTYLTRRNLLILLFVILAAGFGYYFYQYQQLTKSPDVKAKEKTAQVIKEISALAVIPNDPNAVLATVSDVTKLKDQHFFDNAQNGDYIVLFPTAMKAVIYRPSVNKIVNIGPLSSGAGSDTSGGTTASPAPSAPKTTNPPATAPTKQ